MLGTPKRAVLRTLDGSRSSLDTSIKRITFVTGDEMEFLWDDNNTAHIGTHGVSPELAERVFWAGVDNMYASRTRHRYVIEAEVDGRPYRLLCDISAAGTIYPVTCYPL